MNDIESLVCLLNESAERTIDAVDRANATVCLALQEQETLAWQYLWVGMYHAACIEKARDWILANLQCRAKKKMSVPEIRGYFATDIPGAYVSRSDFTELLADRYNLSRDKTHAFCELRYKRKL